MCCQIVFLVFSVIVSCVICAPVPEAPFDRMTELLSRERRKGECYVETKLNRSQGLIIRDDMPPGFGDAEPCRTTLKSPDGKLFSVKLDLAMLNGKRDFLQIIANDQLWYIDKTCAPCHDEVIKGHEISLEFLLTNRSRIQLRYKTDESECPVLRVSPPLVAKNKSNIKRRPGSTFELECLTTSDYTLIGNSRLTCLAAPNGSAHWSSALPYCEKISNCPKIEKTSPTTGLIRLARLRKENSYRCDWDVHGDGDFVEFTPMFSPNTLGHSEYANRSRGLAFYDGEGLLRVDNGVGLRYRTRDANLKIYLNLSARDLTSLRNASFSIEYEIISRRSCPTIDEEAFPFGSITLSDMYFVGSTARFECAPSYTLKGQDYAVCLKDGNWNFAWMPECVPLSAEDVPNHNNDIVAPSHQVTTSETPSKVFDLPTEKDVLAYTDWSIAVKEQTSTVQSIEQESITEPPDTISTTITTSTTTTTTTTGSYSTTPSMDISTLPSASKELIEVASVADLYQRLKNLDLSDKQDVSLLMVVVAAVCGVGLALVLIILLIKYSCKEEIEIRENPLYIGNPARRITNVSFRPNSKHKRAAQERIYS